MSKAINNPNFIATNDEPEGSAPTTGQIVDGFDFPHTGLIKVFNLACAGSYAINGFNGTNINATQATIAGGNVFLKGVFTPITGATVTIPTTANRHHLLVARAGGLVRIQATADNEVPPFADGDVIIALLKYTGSDPMQIQYLTFNQTSKSLSVGRLNGGVYTEGLSIKSNAGHIEIEAKESDKDIIFKVKDGSSVGEEVMRINAADKRVGIGTNAPVAPLHVMTSNTDETLRLQSDDATATTAPDLIFHRNSASPAASDGIGHIKFLGRNAANNADIMYAAMYASIRDTTANQEDGSIIFTTETAGNDRNRLAIMPTEVNINDNSLALNFRVESNSNANMLFVDGTNNRVGIGTNTPAETLDVNGTIKALTAIKSLGTIHSPQLEVVPSNNASLPLTAATHAGRYLLYSGSNGTITLPATSTTGEHYTILNLTGGNITLNPNGSTTINGGSGGAGVTVGTFNGVTCIAIGNNNWIALGV